NAVIEPVLLEPGGEQPRGGEGVDVARVGDAADVVGHGPPAVVDLIDGDVRRGAFPADKPVEVRLRGELEPAFVAAAAGEPAGEHREGLADIDERQVDALVLERGPRAAPVA